MTNGSNNEWPISKFVDRARSITTWKKIRFSPADSNVYRRSPQGEASTLEPEIRAGGWDHEHCILCMAEISLYPGCQPEAYTDESEDEWLCIACYEKYVLPFQRQ